MNPAENQPVGTPAAQAPDSASGAELSIPKHRFDEVAGEVRRLREELTIKDQLYNQRLAALQPRQQEPELTPEQTGLDPSVHQAVVKIAESLAEKRGKADREQFQQQIGFLANRTEKAELLAAHGSDKVKYLPEIQRRQQSHYQMTGSFLPAETALKLIQADESEARIRSLELRLAAQTGGAVPPQSPAAPAQTYTSNAPAASGTRVMPGAAAPIAPQGGGAKSFSQMSVEEMEARLEEQFGSGQVL